VHADGRYHKITHRFSTSGSPMQAFGRNQIEVEKEVAFIH
jgi:hypothetical protein